MTLQITELLLQMLQQKTEIHLFGVAVKSNEAFFLDFYSFE